MEKKYVIGVDLGGTKIYTALVDLQGNMKKEVIVETEAEKGELPVLQKMIDQMGYPAGSIPNRSLYSAFLDILLR